jgi:DNA polymerase-1
MRTLLIDADFLGYSAAAASQTQIVWAPGEVSTTVDKAHAIKFITERVVEYQDTLNSDQVVMALGDAENWRKQILPSYKMNRVNKERPELLSFCREFIRSTWKTFSKPTLEGDDVLGILATAPDLIKGEKIIVSVDKDFFQIPGLLWNPKHPDRGVKRVSLDEADYHHAFQTLTGDSCDGYKGCPGIGPKKALAILGAIPKADYWRAIVDTFATKDLTEVDATIQARVSRICRNEDWDRTKKQVILWEPPKLEPLPVMHNENGEILA